MATIEQRVKALEDWQANIEVKFAALRAFVIEHRRLYDEFIANRKHQDALDAQAAENAKRKTRRRG